MRKKIAQSALLILTIILSAAFTNQVSAQKTADDSIFGISAPQVSTTVVINEIYGGGGNASATYNQDYVELYNKSAADIDLANYTLQYASATGAFSSSNTCTITTTNSPSGTTIPAGGYYLIAIGPVSATVGAALTGVNTTCPAGINLSASAGKIALSSTTTILSATCPPGNGTIVDFVGYGSTANCSETAPAPAPPDNATSIQRFPNGTDTDNNSTDFQTTVPTPKAANIAATPRTLQFSSPTYGVTEGTATVTITVTRTGGSDGVATATYTTSDGSATGGGACTTAGVDYITKTGTVSFPNGSSAVKTFTVAICDDTLVENAETVNLTLSNATGATLGTQNTAVLTITDNDTANTAPTITAASGVTALKGATRMLVQIATVTDDGGNGNVAVTVTSANPSNGITISNIQNGAGLITADITATCAASDASFTLSASDGVNAPVTATLNVGALDSMSATQLAFGQQPTNANSGATITPAVTVQALNACGALVSGFNGAVTVGVNTGSGSLNGTTNVNAVNGTATFGDLNITTATTGSFTLFASSAGLTVATSTAFTVTAASTLPDLTISQSARANVTVGTNYNYLLTVNNSGSAALTTVDVDFTVPTGVTYNAATGSCTTIALVGSVVQFRGCSVAANGSASLTINVSAPATPQTITSNGTGVIVDPNSTIAESNEMNNNAATITTNVNTAPSAAGVTLGGRVTNDAGLGIWRATIVLTGGNLTSPIYAVTDYSGSYNFDNIPAGETYVLNVSVKGYKFSQSNIVINLADSYNEAHFVGTPKQRTGGIK